MENLPTRRIQPAVHDGLERLANRLALLVADDGEAASAGRAAGSLARRLGLSGGQLKAIFLAGVRAAGLRIEVPSDVTDEVAAPPAAGDRESATLRRLLDRSDAERREVTAALRLLETENKALRDGLRRARRGRAVWRALLLFLVLSGAAGAASWVWQPDLRRPLLQAATAVRAWAEAQTAAAPPVEGRLAVVGQAGADVLEEPRIGAAIVTRLAPGLRLSVRRLVWRDLGQWAEIETAGRVGYAQVAALDLQ